MKDNVLYVRFFGGFSMIWNGAQLVGTIRSCETQFAHFMQMLLHDRDQGVDRLHLAEELFGDRELQDVSHSLHVLCYNVRKKLRAKGLPAVEYIEIRQGRYYWTPEIPVIEDTAVFEAACREADACADEEEKLFRALSACDLYTGDFLPMQTGSLWVFQETRRYQVMFGNCVNQAAALLRQKNLYVQLEALGKHAAAVQPLSEWECLILEAQIALGRYEEAEKTYQKTEQQYFQKLKIHPGARMLGLREQITAGRQPGQQALDVIQAQLSGDEARGPGAYLCSYTTFEVIYRMIERFAARGGQAFFLMQCTLAQPGDAAGSLPEPLRQRFEQAICSSLRQTDAVCRYGEEQYLALLVNASKEDCAAIQKRITDSFRGTQGVSIQYYVNALFQK